MIKNKINNIFRIGIASLVIYIIAIIAIIILITIVFVSANAINGEVTVDLFLQGIASFCLFVLAILLFIVVDILNIFICVYIGTFPVDSSNNLYNKKSAFLICAVIFTIFFSIIPPILAISWASIAKKQKFLEQN
ncbi:MAG: hypothetical protein IKG09_02145 [Mycoplasmataceae bacterium]|nr:hypothetical protein [Mycoplasmataceae bacterium]